MKKEVCYTKTNKKRRVTGETGMKYADPYTPGAGFMPGHIAGRKETLERAEKYLNTIVLGYPQQSVIYYGLRGVGKTVLLNAIECKTDDMPILMGHIEIAEKRNFTQQITNYSKKFIHKMSFKETAKDFVSRVQDLLKAFTVTYNPEDQSFKVGMEEREYIVTGDLSEDLTDLFVAMGKMADKTGYAICFFVDEIQYMKEEEIAALVNAIHRCNQLRLPLMIFGAGLPKILKTLGKVKSYSERLFRFEEIDALSGQDAKDAIVKPAEPLGGSYTEEALRWIISETQGYPYFIQELCSAIWEHLNPEQTVIGIDDVKGAVLKFYEISDRRILHGSAMTDVHQKKKCLFLQWRNVRNYHVRFRMSLKLWKQKSLQYRLTGHNSLIKCMIYATGYAEIDFTVPGFDQFLKRLNPELQLDEVEKVQKGDAGDE